MGHVDWDWLFPAEAYLLPTTHDMLPSPNHVVGRACLTALAQLAASLGGWAERNRKAHEGARHTLRTYASPRHHSLYEHSGAFLLALSHAHLCCTSAQDAFYMKAAAPCTLKLPQAPPNFSTTRHARVLTTHTHMRKGSGVVHAGIAPGTRLGCLRTDIADGGGSGDTRCVLDHLTRGACMTHPNARSLHCKVCLFCLCPTH
eukprot:1142706-Pelagomonas_calceolata.AAC.2